MMELTIFAILELELYNKQKLSTLHRLFEITIHLICRSCKYITLMLYQADGIRLLFV